MSATPETHCALCGAYLKDAAKAMEALPALLAIAKGADEFDTRAELREKINALDAAHPGWREWA